MRPNPLPPSKMKSIKYSIFDALEKKERNTFLSVINFPTYKILATPNFPTYKDRKINTLLTSFIDLLHFTLDAGSWLEELYVCERVITIGYKDNYEVDKRVINFYLHYYYDFLNKLYVFNERVNEFFKYDQRIKKTKISDLRALKEYASLITKFRNKYVHNWISLNVRQSLGSGEIIFSHEISSSVEIYSPVFIRETVIEAYKIMIKILEDLDLQIFDLTRGEKPEDKEGEKVISVTIKKGTTKSLFENSTHIKFKTPR